MSTTRRLAPLEVLSLAAALALTGCASPGSSASNSAPRPAPTVTVTREAAPVKLVRPAAPIPHTVPAATPAGSPAARTEPVIFTAGTYIGTEPVEIDFSADAGNVAYGLTWRNWPGGPNGWPGAERHCGSYRHRQHPGLRASLLRRNRDAHTGNGHPVRPDRRRPCDLGPDRRDRYRRPGQQLRLSAALAQRSDVTGQPGSA